MKYLCLAYEEEKKLNALSQSEWDALGNGDSGLCRGPAEERRSDRQHGAGSKRQAVGDRRPFAETKEQLGGFFLIDARDLNEAIQVASRWPSARLGSIEVRPIEEQLRQDSRYG
jgi:hypothetical protein